MEILLIISFLLLGISIYSNINLLKKNEKMEDVNKYYAELFIQLSKAIKLSDERLKEIDERGTFKSDDEIGWFFEQISHIQEVLNKFNENF